MARWTRASSGPSRRTWSACGRSRSTMAAARPRITPPSVSATWWRIRSVSSRNACSGWSPSVRVAPSARRRRPCRAAAAARGQAGEERRRPLLPLVVGDHVGHRHREGLGDGHGDGAVERQVELPPATAGPMMLPPDPNDAESVTIGAMSRSLPLGGAPAARDSRVALQSWFLRRQSGRTRVLVAAAFGVLAALIVAWFAPWQLTVLIAWDVMARSRGRRVWSRSAASPPSRLPSSRSVRTTRGPAPTSCCSARRWSAWSASCSRS